MSYDFEMLLVPPGEDVAEAAMRLFERQEREVEEHGPGTAEASPEDVKRRQRVVAALQREAPFLTAFSFDYAEIGRTLGITPDEAARRFQHVELNEESSGIQVTVRGSTSTLTVPYWHQGNTAEDVCRRIWSCLQALAKEGGYQVFDPQLGRGLDLEADFGVVLAAYTRVTEQLLPKDASAPSAGRSNRPPWWRFW